MINPERIVTVGMGGKAEKNAYAVKLPPRKTALADCRHNRRYSDEDRIRVRRAPLRPTRRTIEVTVEVFT
jgi:hypothetical protein